MSEIKGGEEGTQKICDRVEGRHFKLQQGTLVQGERDQRTSKAWSGKDINNKS